MWTKELLDKLNKYNVVLGSSSTLRRQFFSQNLGVPSFSVVTSTFEENLPKNDYTAAEYVSETARRKIDSIVAALDPHVPSILVVADTIVCSGDQVFEKPGTAAEQLRMLAHYRDTAEVTVMTAVHVCRVQNGQTGPYHSNVASTHLHFNIALTDEQLQFYVASNEGLHVAGGFKFQEMGSMLFVDLLGDYFNVVGLPVRMTYELLQAALTE